jgi:hypothetical protein
VDVVETLKELADLVDGLAGQGTDVFVRWSTGPEDDAGERSVDHASGLELPGLSVTTLTPPGWWSRPTEGWVARQVRAYAHLGDAGSDSYAWVLCGRPVDRGPDNEPLVVDVTPLARLAPAVLQTAADREPQSPRPEDHAGK